MKGLDASPVYSLWSLNVEKVSVKYLKLHSCVEKYESGSMTNTTNTSYLAGLPLGKKTMSIAGGHTNIYKSQLFGWVAFRQKDHVYRRWSHK